MFLNRTFSFYEGHSIHEITFPIRVLKLLGINSLISTYMEIYRWKDLTQQQIVTNAAGGLNPNYAVGDLVVVSDVSLSFLGPKGDITPHPLFSTWTLPV